MPTSSDALEVGARLPALDGLRGFACLQVIAYHYVIVNFLYGTEHLRPSAAVRFLKLTGEGLFSGVDLFFVLSGFLICRILLTERSSRAYYRTFYLRRICRIFPLYYAFLAVAAISTMAGLTVFWPNLSQPPVSAWWYPAFAQNLAMAAYGTMGTLALSVTWSLAVEEQFYLVLPPLVRNLSTTALTWFGLGCMAIAPLTREIIYKFHVLPSSAAYVLLLSRCDALAAGVLLAIALTHHRERLLGAARWLPVALLTVGVYTIVQLCRVHPRLVALTFLDRTLMAVFYGLALAHVVVSPQGRIARALCAPFMRKCGDLSYCMYLIHLTVFVLVARLITGGTPTLTRAADAIPIVVAAVATFALARASWRFFERPLVRVGHSFTY